MSLELVFAGFMALVAIAVGYGINRHFDKIDGKYLSDFMLRNYVGKDDN